MKSILFILLCIINVVYAQTDTTKKPVSGIEKNFPVLIKTVADSPEKAKLTDSLYKKFNLIVYGLDKSVFYKAYKGYQYLLSKNKLTKKDILTIIDYNRSGNNRRMYVIDMAKGKVLFNNYVSHGRSSGREYATMFSNVSSSNMSSLGFMVTAETYIGGSGYSMRFDGMEQGVNDLVRSRAIVMHGSKYVGDAALSARGKTGNSLGCPAIPMDEHRMIIDSIKKGSCLFIYYPDSHYLNTSTILNTDFEWPALKKPIAPANNKTETPAKKEEAFTKELLLENL